jgi:hypothetical protein
MAMEAWRAAEEKLKAQRESENLAS